MSVVFQNRSQPGARPVGEGAPALLTAARGADPRLWRTVKAYSRIRTRGVYPGVDVVFRGSADGGLEYDFEAAAGSPLDRIRIAFWYPFASTPRET